MKPQEEIAQLKKDLAAKDEQIQGLLKKLKDQEALGVGKGKSKSRIQAEGALELLKQGPVTVAQLKTLNEKYPADCIYYARTILKVDVKTVRTASGSLYMLPEHFVTYQAGLAREKEAGKDAKEEIQATPIPHSAQTRTTGTALAV